MPLPSPPVLRRVSLRFTFGVLLTATLALSLFYLLMRPSMPEIRAMAWFLAITAGVSAAAGYGAYRLGWLSRLPRLRWTLLGSYALAAVLTFLNVWLTARLMFASQHDLQLATVLLVFASGIAMSLGYFFSSAVVGDIQALGRGAAAIAQGDLAARVEIRGRNELSDLARTFNEMAARLEAADQRQRQVETMRRNLVAWAGHDLHTPLASIQALTEALADGMVEDPVTVERYLRTVQRQVHSLSALIDDLFDLAQFDAGDLTLDRIPADPADLISDAIERFSEPAARQGITLRGEVANELGAVFVDVQKMDRVLSNLIGNALRHTPAGGAITVRARPATGGVQLEVADTGEGVSAEDLPHIFEQFYRGEKSRSRTTGGSGLGLAIARDVVQAHGGELHVESAPGAGARFYFTLPTARP